MRRHHHDPTVHHVRDLTITDEDFAPVVSGASFQIKRECVSIVGDDGGDASFTKGPGPAFW